ncbi:NACHT domain-containing protein [filamentous cyanobacterium LEGE 11480]|uniref:NACHT domain-containing protein n=1 Tax=Romeriopsis navalis LEGE 11480 TaxID=2777977 RepID=A0A928Z3Q7_9CYAN|nr:BTAD domain-containing putative transcriptional regulator [Romeriopsis navalis]MBE9029493.1 NACHT domain-containing protein [Romeriopsis navalis LEGE 11480]
MLRINLFGYLKLTFEQQTIVGLQSERYQSLLAYIVLQTQSPQPRSQLASVFWPDVSDQKAKANLRRALSRIKKVLPQADRFLQVTPNTVHWQPQLPCWLDVAEFEAQVAQAAVQQADPSRQIATLKAAISLYQDGLLLTCYDNWIEPIRHRLHQHVIQALAELGRLLGEVGDDSEAIAYTQQLLQLDPLNESACLMLMQLYVGQGERVNALQLYQQFASRLKQEIGIVTSGPMRQFYEQLLADEIPILRPSSNPMRSAAAASNAARSTSQTVVPHRQIDWGEAPDQSGFYGRTAELAQLSQWMIQDRCRLVTVCGLGGVGKTALAAKAAHELQAEFDCVIWRSLHHGPQRNDVVVDLIKTLSNQQETSSHLARLMYWLRQSRCLVIFDHFEILFQAGAMAGQYRTGYENYAELLAVVGQACHQSCLLLTSREQPFEIASLVGVNAAIQTLAVAGSAEVALSLVEAQHLVGSSSEKVLLCKQYADIPLALQIICCSVRDVFAGEIATFLDEEIWFIEPIKRGLQPQVDRLTALEKVVMIQLALHSGWTSFTELKSNMPQSCTAAKLMAALESLRWRSLIECQDSCYKQLPVIAAYLVERLLEQLGDALIPSAHLPVASLRRLLAITPATPAAWGETL